MNSLVAVTSGCVERRMHFVNILIIKTWCIFFFMNASFRKETEKKTKFTVNPA